MSQRRNRLSSQRVEATSVGFVQGGRDKVFARPVDYHTGEGEPSGVDIGHCSDGMAKVIGAEGRARAG